MKKFYAILSFVLALLCLTAPITQVVSAAETSPAVTETSLDYSSEDDYMLQAVLSPSDLLTLLLETIYKNESALSEAEKSYLDRYFSEYLVYDGLLPPSLLSTEKSDSSVTVTAQGYSYIAKNGQTVSYLPVRALLGAKELPLVASSDGQHFSVTVTDLPSDTDPTSVTVFYQGSITLPKETVNQLVTMAYRDAKNALATEETMLQYTVALEEYQAYLRAIEQYEADCLNYDFYLSSLALYENALAEYKQNQRDWEIYRQKNKLYEEYLAKLATYDKEKKLYDKAYAEYTAQDKKYKAYLQNLDAIRISLHPMESLFLTPSDGSTGTLYRALQNSELVVMFEKYQGVLSKTFGIPKETITNLRTDADLLNDLLGEYNKARTISEEAAFIFYKENYDQICSLFNSLYQRMSDILKPAVYTLMCAKLELEYPEDKGTYKKWRIKNVLAHIYLICLCLDDERTPDNTWSFYADDGEPHPYYFSDLLNQNLIISDSNAANPSDLSWIPEVTELTPPVAPTEPIAVQQPIPPATLAEPTKPAEVTKPTAPMPKEEPIPPTQSDHELVLRTGEICLAYLDGALSERQELSEDPSIRLPEISVQKRIGAPSVFGARGVLLDVSDLSSLPTPSDNSALLPISFENEYATYTFDGWSEPTGHSLLRTSDDTFVYAKYRRKAKCFEATFIIDGTTVSQISVPVGTTPVFVGSTNKASTPSTDYVFTTWDPPLSPIYGNTEYVAQYREQVRNYTVTFAMEGQSLSQQVAWQATPTAPITPASYYSGGSLYEFDAWDKPLTPTTDNITYTARYRELSLAQLPNTSIGSLSVAPSATGYVLVSSEPRFSLSALVAKAASEEKRLEIIFTDRGVSLTFDPSALQSLQQQGICELLLDQNPSYGTAIRCFRNDGTEISLGSGELRLNLEHGFATEKNIYLSAYYPALDRCQENIPCTSTSTTTQLLAATSVYYQPHRRFSLTLNVSEHGQAMASTTVYSAGEKILLTIRPDSNYRLSSLVFTDPVSGEQIATDPKNLTMPSFDAVLSVEFVPIEYQIEFQYHGQTIVQVQPFGSTVIFPEIPTSFEEDGFFYTFIGWSSTSSIVTGDMTYIANYYSIRAEEVADSGEGGAIESVVVDILLPISIIALFLLGVIITVPILIVKHVKKKKKNRTNKQ
ncbi:MAG: hypothetical protein J6Q82_07925 [Clostridia bacterium]|nr:hypothetical protein [Clostridia bacterium]